MDDVCGDEDDDDEDDEDDEDEGEVEEGVEEGNVDNDVEEMNEDSGEEGVDEGGEMTTWPPRVGRGIDDVGIYKGVVDGGGCDDDDDKDNDNDVCGDAKVDEDEEDKWIKEAEWGCVGEVDDIEVVDDAPDDTNDDEDDDDREVDEEKPLSSDWL